MKRQANLSRNHRERAKVLKIYQETELSNSYKNSEGEKATRKDINNVVILLLIFILWSVLELRSFLSFKTKKARALSLG